MNFQNAFSRERRRKRKYEAQMDVMCQADYTSFNPYSLVLSPLGYSLLGSDPAFNSPFSGNIVDAWDY
jgi:hypothetical protein